VSPGLVIAATYRSRDLFPVEEPEAGYNTGFARVLFPEVFMHMSDFQKMERKPHAGNSEMIKILVVILSGMIIT